MKVALGNRGMRVDAGVNERKSGEPCSDRPPVLLWLSPGEGWDAVT